MLRGVDSPADVYRLLSRGQVHLIQGYMAEEPGNELFRVHSAGLVFPFHSEDHDIGIRGSLSEKDLFKLPYRSEVRPCKFHDPLLGPFAVLRISIGRVSFTIKNGPGELAYCCKDWI